MKCLLIYEDSLGDVQKFQGHIISFIRNGWHDTISVEMHEDNSATDTKSDIEEYINFNPNYCKGESNMGVKIMKEPVEISLKELRELDEEVECIIIEIDQDKVKQFNEDYGLDWEFKDEMKMCNGEIELKKKALNWKNYSVPFDFIKRILKVV